MSRGQQKKFAVVMSKYHRVSVMKSEEAAKKLLASYGSNPISGVNASPDVRVHAELNVSSMDQPERRGSNYIMLGGGTYTSRWRHSANLSHVSANLQACDDCLVANVLMANQAYHAAESDTQGMRSCQRCTCWRTQGVGSSILEFPIPESYPPDMAPPSGTLRSVVLTYERSQVCCTNGSRKGVQRILDDEGSKSVSSCRGHELGGCEWYYRV
jgi:hypothetical protein